MTTRNSTRRPAGSSLSASSADMNRHITRVDQIIGVARLAREAVFQEAGEDKALGATWAALDMALHTLDELRYDLEGVPQQYRWNEAERIREHRSIGGAVPEPNTSDESDDRTAGQRLYDDVAEFERQLKSLMDKIPYETLGDLPESHPTAQAFLTAEVHVQDAVAELRKVRDAELPPSLKGGES